MDGPLSQEVAAVFTVPNVSVPVPGEGQTIVYVPTLGLRPEAPLVVGVLQMLTEHGLDEAIFVRSDGSIKNWSDWSDEDRWEIWGVIQKVRQSLTGGIGDFLKSQVPGFDGSPRHLLAKQSGWHLHQSVGETCLETVIRPWRDDRHPVSSMSLALPGDYVSVLTRDSQSPSGVTLSTVAVGQYSPVPFGKTVIHDDLLSDAKERASQLRRLLNPASGLPFSLAFQAVIIPNEVTAPPGGVDARDESADGGAPSGGGGGTWFEPGSAVVNEADIIDPTAGPESLLRAVSTILSLPEAHPTVVSMMKVFSLVRQSLASNEAFVTRVTQSQSPTGVPGSSSSSTGSPPRRPARSAPGTPASGVRDGGT
jgi:hypothetical protein